MSKKVFERIRRVFKEDRLLYRVRPKEHNIYCHSSDKPRWKSPSGALHYDFQLV